MNKIFKYIRNPRIFFSKVLMIFSPCFRRDQKYLSIFYYMNFGRKLNLDAPISFNEKLNWLKLNYHNNLCHILVDKYEVKSYVADKIGAEYVVPHYKVWNNPDEITISDLPDKFVIKMTHDSGKPIICNDKSAFDFDKYSKQIRRRFEHSYYGVLREWVYKDVCPRIIAEELLEDPNGKINDYKFWCFNGMPKYMYVTVKGDSIFENFYDMSWQPVDIQHRGITKNEDFLNPCDYPGLDVLNMMKHLSSVLSEGFPFVRVDFFYVSGRIYFSEYTFYDWGGMNPFVDYSMDLNLGRLINLPVKKNSL